MPLYKLKNQITVVRGFDGIAIGIIPSDTILELELGLDLEPVEEPMRGLSPAEFKKGIKDFNEAFVPPPKPERWKPETENRYWYVDSDITIQDTYWDGDDLDNDHFVAHNVFQTKKQAERAAESVKECLKKISEG